jgi:2-polyprenyl-6-methoxyphenol hydroxylase-like FAD-dependent oxidoreductase
MWRPPTMASVTSMDTDVLVVGGGPVGLTAALELRRRAVDAVVVDRRESPAPFAKAVGIQPRTVELWDCAGVARAALDAAATLRGALVFVNGKQRSRVDLRLPDEVPYRFLSLPQYETERVLAESLATFGTRVERGVELVDFRQDGAAVTSTVRDGDGERTITSRYLVGCDGAHSLVRTKLGLAFEGGAIAQEFMLADVELDWDLPVGYSIRATHQRGEVIDDLLVCIPLPGHGRYRISMFVPEELTTKDVVGDGVQHGLEGGRAPQLRHVQAVLDRLAPQSTTASHLRWSSVFRISHRLVDRYSVGRVFVAGDAAHIHPPTGAQGMNTGVQDAFNLGWKLELAVRDVAAEGLLDSYHAERHPVGEEVVGRTVRAARAGIDVGEGDLAVVLAREAQLLVGYPDSPLVGEDVATTLLGTTAPLAGQRAPDATGLRQDTVSYPIRLHDLLRHGGHTLLLWAGDPRVVQRQRRLSDEIGEQLRERVRCHIIVGADVLVPDPAGPLLSDGSHRFATAYGTSGAEVAAYVIRPDGYVGFRADDPTARSILDHLRRTLRW